MLPRTQPKPSALEKRHSKRRALSQDGRQKNGKADDHCDSSKKRRLLSHAENMPVVYRPKGKANPESSRRSSTRLQNKNQMDAVTPGKPILTDSAYDGDEESSPSATQSEGDNDPYSLSAMEEVPALPHVIKKKKGKTLISKKRTKVATTKVRAVKVSSTPNQTNPPATRLRKSTRRSHMLEATPEVTPILPVKSPVPAENLSTPHINHLTRRRGASSPASTSASSSLQSSSQADSGIAVSPPVKRACVQSGEKRLKTAAGQGKKLMNKRNIFSPNSKQKSGPSSDSADSKENMDTSCFGFSSLNTPEIPKVVKKQKIDSVDDTAYRNLQPLLLSDSSPGQPLTSTDSENLPDSLQHPCPSPGLFSDDIFSADSESLSMNKSSAKTYKPTKFKKLKQKKSISKFEAWAMEKNMEMEEMEKFDLNIE